ncbi:MAG: PadR family transcriptional regulator [Pseudomonadota bacterium]
MSKTNYLGEFEIVVMASMVRLGDNAYGAAILEDIERRADRLVSVGALHATLARLEKKAYVQSKIGNATPVRGGRARRYYTPTAEGKAQLERSARMFSVMLKGLSGWGEGVFA